MSDTLQLEKKELDMHEAIINSSIPKKPKPKGDSRILKFREESISAMQLFELRVACIPMVEGNTIVGYEVRIVHVKAENLEAAYDTAIKHGYTPIN